MSLTPAPTGREQALASMDPTKVAVAAVLDKLSTGYRVQLADEEVQVWWEVVGHYPEHVLREATYRCLRTWDRFPAISQFVEACRAEQQRWAEENPPIGYDGKPLPPGTF